MAPSVVMAADTSTTIEPRETTGSSAWAPPFSSQAVALPAPRGRDGAGRDTADACVGSTTADACVGYDAADACVGYDTADACVVHAHRHLTAALLGVAGVRGVVVVDLAGRVLAESGDLAFPVEALGRAVAALGALGGDPAIESDVQPSIALPLGTITVDLEGLVVYVRPFAELPIVVGTVAAVDADRTPIERELDRYAGRPWSIERVWVRPYVLTGGRTGSPISNDALVWAVKGAAGRLRPEHRRVLTTCGAPRSINEIAKATGIVPAVVRVIVSDLLADELVIATNFEIANVSLYARVVEGLAALV